MSTPLVNLVDKTRPSRMQALRLRSAVMSHNLRLLRRRLFGSVSIPWTVRTNADRYQGWATDNPTADLTHTKPVLLNKSLYIVSGQLMYQYVVEAISERIQRNRDAVSRVLEIGAGSGRVCLRLAKQFPEITFYAVEPTLDGCLAIQRGVDSWALSNVKVVNSGAESLNKHNLPLFDFIYSELAFEQIGARDVAKRAIKCALDLGRSGCMFYFREPWRDFNGPLQNVYLDAMTYLPLDSNDLKSARPVKLSTYRCSFQHNLHFRVAVAEGTIL